MSIVRGVPLVLVVALLLLSAALTLAEPPRLYVDMLFDDAYYYLGVARHLALGDGSLFTAPLRTNGYQPLWLLLLTPMAFVVSGDRTLLVAAMHLAILGSVLAFVVIAWRQEGATWPAALTALCFPQVMLQGMETVLVVPLALLYFRAQGWRRGLFAALLFLVRLDALGLIAAFELYRWIRGGRPDLAVTALLGATILVYAAINFTLFGTPLPISGLAKALGNSPGENWRVGLALLYNALPVLAILGLAFALRRHVDHRGPILAALGALVASTLYYGINSGWPLWSWYCWPITLLFYFALLELRGCPPGLGRVAGGIVLGVASLPALASNLDRFATPRADGATWGQANVTMAGLADAAPAPARFAMGDRAGSFGYFLADRHQMIQTEGLVADRAFLTALAKGRGEAFLDRAAIDTFIVDRDHYYSVAGIVAIPEPVQGLSAHHGVMLLCFPASAELPAYRLRKERRAYRYAARVACPPAASAWFRDHLRRYGAIHRSSFAIRDIPSATTRHW